jgi:hypothetical protein
MGGKSCAPHEDVHARVGRARYARLMFGDVALANLPFADEQPEDGDDTQ